MRRAVGDALADLRELERRTRCAERLGSKGYVRGRLNVGTSKWEARLVRHKRHFGPNDAAALLKAIGECRHACTTASSKAEIGGPVYRSVSRLMGEIDLVAEALTGHRIISPAASGTAGREAAEGAAATVMRSRAPAVETASK